MPRSASIFRRQRWWLTAVCASLAIGFDCATLRFLWRTTDLTLGQYQMGYFEEPGGAASLVLDDAQRTSVQPDVGLDPTGALSLPPGRSVGFSLREGVEYRVRVEDRDWAPFCVFGNRAAIGGGDGPPAFRIEDARVLAVSEDGLGDAPWTIMRPWREDQGTLEALRRRCMTGGRSDADVVVRVRGGLVDVEYGVCTHRLSRTSDVMAILAGPSWTVVREARGWRTELMVQGDVLLIIVGVSLLRFATAAFVIGAGQAMLLALAILIAAAVSPAAGIIAFVLLFLVGLAAAGILVLRGAGAPRSTMRLAAGGLLLLIPAAVVLLMFMPLSFSAQNEPAGAPTRCLLLGYSSMRGDSLRQDAARGVWGGKGGVWEYLPHAQACAGSVQRRARAAGRFSWTRDVLCGDDPGVLAGGNVLFLGGSNDDFFWARFQASRVTQLIGLARYAYERPSAEEWRRLRAAVEGYSLAALADQNQVVKEALGCAARREATFSYFHDFLAWDLADPRSVPRQQMLAARAKAVRAARGTFVDLLDRVADEAGVWWFNDYIHPSEIGHRRIGEIMTHEVDLH